MYHDCAVPGCTEPGRHYFKINLMRPDTTAIFGRNTGAHLCDRHAESGFELDIVVRPNRKRQADIYTWAEYRGSSGKVEHVNVPIEEGTTAGPKRGGNGSRDNVRRGRVERPRP